MIKHPSVVVVCRSQSGRQAGGVNKTKDDMRHVRGR